MVISEAQADFVLVTELADRVLVEQVDWLEEEHLESSRAWLNDGAGGKPLFWKSVSTLARAAGIRAHGHFQGEPGEADAQMARRAIRFVKLKFPSVDAIVLSRDQDEFPNRKTGLRQAVEAEVAHPTILIALADREREAWVICGFEPQSDQESSRLAEERQNLGFDPCQRSRELTACKDDAAKRSPKRVLHALTGGDREREAVCWRETALDSLRDRGRENGLSDYLAEVQEKLVPQLGWSRLGQG